MVSQATKLRFRRRLRRGRKQVENLGSQAEGNIERHIIDRLERLLHVRRFIVSWFGLILLLSVLVLFQTVELSQYYQNVQPVAGGLYAEGILGDFSTASPLYASSSVDSAVSRLIFSGLFTYNNHNQLVGDLAQSWSVDSTGKTYTVILKPHLVWQDGQSLTAADVVFTYRTIQNPDTLSPYIVNWQSVKVSQTGPLSVQFALTNPLSSFPDSLTNGIIPQHLLNTIPVDELRTAKFNIDPIGAGPFVWKLIAVQGDTPSTRQQQITLAPFTHYNGGKPKLKQFTVRAFHDQGELVTSFQQGEINGIAGLNSVPGELSKDKALHIYSLPLTAANMVFFKTTNGVLADSIVRQALVEAANTNKIINGLGYPVIPVNEPLLIGQLGYDPAYAQVTNEPFVATQQLQQDGWSLGGNGVRFKNKQSLTFQLFTADTQEDHYIAGQLQKEWRSIGANVNVVYQSASDIQYTVSFHSYDALLYGISIGVDPDVFVYWDSSQANISSPSHLNFSEYQSTVVDQSLEAGRTVTDPQLRTIKYQPFLQTWQQNAPALGLFQPHFLYLTSEPIYGLNEHSINVATDRFNNVQDWAVRLGKVND